MAKKIAAGNTRQDNADGRELTASDVLYEGEQKRALDTVIIGGQVSGDLTVLAIGDNVSLDVVSIADSDWTEVTNTLTGQKSVAVQNQSTSTNLLFRYADPGAGTSTGWIIYPGGHKIMLIKPGVSFYLRSAGGSVQTCIDRLGE